MKSIRVIALLSLLVLFPLVSYLYLRQGYYFRLNALNELQPKSKLSEFNYESFDPDASFGLMDISHKTTLLYDQDQESSQDMLRPIFEEFSHREDFQLIGFTSDTSVYERVSGNSILNKQWRLAKSNYIWDKHVALIDTGGFIRNHYTLDSISFLSLGQHIPIVLPRKKELDIKMKK